MCILAYKSGIVFANNSPLCLLLHLHELSLTKESLWSIEINFFSHIYILALDSGSLVARLCIQRERARVPCVRVFVRAREGRREWGNSDSDFPHTPDDCITLRCQSCPWRSSLKAPFPFPRWWQWVRWRWRKWEFRQKCGRTERRLVGIQQTLHHQPSFVWCAHAAANLSLLR